MSGPSVAPQVGKAFLQLIILLILGPINFRQSSHLLFLALNPRILFLQLVKQQRIQHLVLHGFDLPIRRGLSHIFIPSRRGDRQAEANRFCKLKLPPSPARRQAGFPVRLAANRLSRESQGSDG